MQQLEQLPFFVYGTLLPDQPNFYLWGSAITQMEPATFFGGRLHDMGFYPMLVAAEPETAVQGQLISVDKSQYSAVVARLDELEGYDPTQPENSAYHRQQVDVIASNGRSQKAWAYLGQPTLVSGKPEVSHGDWLSYAAENQLELQAWWETLSTVAGLNPKQSNG